MGSYQEKKGMYNTVGDHTDVCFSPCVFLCFFFSCAFFLYLVEITLYG